MARRACGVAPSCGRCLMRLPGQIAAAIEVLADIETRHRPVADALRDWGLSHRFAGAGDRAVIGNLVYDALRRRVSLAWRMGGDTPWHLVLGVALLEWGQPAEPSMLPSPRTGMPPLRSTNRLLRRSPREISPRRRTMFAPTCRSGSRRCWRQPLPAEWVEEGAALATRPPLDLRVNTLKADREKVAGQLGAPCGRARRRTRPSVFASRRSRGRAGIRTSRRRKDSSAAASRCRTRAASSRRCLQRQRRRAGARSLRRGGRQDAGARGAHGEPRPDLRHRHATAHGSRRSSTA